jgi:DNA-binding transcriptional LysR family regulator
MTSAGNRFSIKVGALHESSTVSASRKLHRLRVNLKQWAIVHAIIDYGGFANAAEHLNLSQSAISYSVAKLQEQLGVNILKIEGRKAQLTEHGIRLLKYSRQLVQAAAELENYAINLQQKVTDIKIAVNEYFPTPILMDGIRLFSLGNRHVSVELIEASEEEIERLLDEQVVDLAISSAAPDDLTVHPLLEVEYVPVAHPDHALFGLNREILRADLDGETEVIFVEPEKHPLARGQRGTLHARFWKVKNYDTAVSALCEGLGYAWLPRLRIERALMRGKLKILPIAGYRSFKKPMYLFCGRSVTKAEQIDSLITVLDQVIPKSLPHSAYVPVLRPSERAA